MVNPDIGRTLNSNAVSIGGKDLLADNVSDDDVGDLPNEESNTRELCKMVRKATNIKKRTTYWNP